MKILMLGNSFTYFHDLPLMLGKLLKCSVKANTRGGAYLFEHLNNAMELGEKTIADLTGEKWDYVVMQEQSIGPIEHPESFFASVKGLSELIRGAGAVPVLYASWAYKEGGAKLSAAQMDYSEMADALRSAYHKAAEENRALVADVGDAFDALRHYVDLYEEDSYHPSDAGSVLAASVIADVIRNDAERRD